MQPIIILGIGRSGTSTIAGVLFYCGVFMGNNFVPANERNPIGYFENKNVVDKMKERDKGLCSIDDVFKEIQKSKKNDKPWGVKFPRLINFTDDLIGHFPHATYLIVKRSKPQVIKSLQKTKDKDAAEKMYETRRKNIEYIENHHFLRTEQVNIDAFSTTDLERAENKIRRLAKSIGINPNKEQLENASLLLTFTSHGK